MPSAIHLSLPAWSLLASRKKARRRFRTLHSPLKASSRDQRDDEESPSRNNHSVQGKGAIVLVERYGNGTARRYVLDDELGLRSSLEEHVSGDDRLGDPRLLGGNLSWLPIGVRDFVLPAGFPGSVSGEYLQYMLLQFPTNVTGWICHALVTSSLLKAVGIGSFDGTTAAASAAAIRWVSKDGIGAVGRLFIGGRFGDLFDDDPKQWRMYADLIGSAGSIFDLTTQVYPGYFLPLASLGNLTKAVARGLKDPSARVIQNHFAISGNLGEISAKKLRMISLSLTEVWEIPIDSYSFRFSGPEFLFKEEVWEVSAQLVGLALGILILDSGLVKSYPALSLTWMSTRLIHLWLRYQSLSVLRFDTINMKRARMLVKAHVIHSIVQGSIDCNREENIFSWESFTKPRITYGVPLENMVDSRKSVAELKQLLQLYAKEKYILVLDQQKKDFEVFVSFKVGATSMSILRSLWQTYWLHEHWESTLFPYDLLAQSLKEMEMRFGDFIEQLQSVGWDTNQINIKEMSRSGISCSLRRCTGPEQSSVGTHPLLAEYSNKL